MVDGFTFWNLVDKNNPYGSAKALADIAGINYRHMVQQRADCRVPKCEDVLIIADALNLTMEYLLTGKKEKKRVEKHYPERIENIAKWLLMFATEEDFTLVERVLRMPGKNTGIQTSKIG